MDVRVYVQHSHLRARYIILLLSDCESHLAVHSQYVSSADHLTFSNFTLAAPSTRRFTGVWRSVTAVIIKGSRVVPHTHALSF